jgi:AcrR family transcriptional regulator
MPKIVNHHIRREQLAEATWRVIRQKGLEGVSVRGVAEEAGISLGALRHYFSTQSELLSFSMRLVSERIKERIEKLDLNGDPRQDIEKIIAELVPLDEERLAECEVWLAFTARALFDENLRIHSKEVHHSLYILFRQIIDSLIRLKLTRQDVDAELETKRLHALVDGLVVHGVTRAQSFTPEDITRIVSYHLDRILR